MEFYAFKRINDDWTTPNKVYEKLNMEFGFNDDPCPLHGINDIDGLSRAWGSRVYINPPYSNPRPWVERAIEHSLTPGNLAVMLLKADTSTILFHEVIAKNAHEIRFIKGRLKYGDSGKPAPFPSMIVIFKKNKNGGDGALIPGRRG